MLPSASLHLSRREFVGALCASAACGGILAACTGRTTALTEQSFGRIAGDVVDLTGLAQPSLGKVYLMYENGMQTGRYVAVNDTGRFVLDDVPVGAWQLRFHAPGVAYVPEEFPHPVRLAVAADQTTTVRFTIERGWEDGTPMMEIYIGDYFFQEQPLGVPNAEAVAKIGTPICWYNVGLMQHTATGGPWDSGALDRTASYIWVPDHVGVFPYTCRFHQTQMIASLRVTS